MYSKRRSSFLRTATFRLTLWYTMVFGGLSLVVFLIVYASLTSDLRKHSDKELVNEAAEFETLYNANGLKALQAEFRREAESRGIKHVFFRLLSPEGKVLAASNLNHWKDLKAQKLQTSNFQTKQQNLSTLALPDQLYRVRVITKPTGNGNVIQIGVTLQGNEIMMDRYRKTFGTALFIMLTCGGFIGWLIAKKAMSGVHRITHTTTKIGKGDFGQRVPHGNEGEEINALAGAFNEMLERIESLVRELKQMTDNVAHELRTPITRIRGIAETTLNGSENLNEYREMAASVIEGCDHLVEMINTMLEIAKTDSGTAELSRKPLEMREIIEEAADLFKPLAEDKNIEIQLVTSPQAVIVSGDRPRLQRAVANLLDNAIKYTPSGGTVTLSVDADAADVKVEITDTGTGIDKKNIPLIFNRFYRSDESRSTSGSGLGLSLALAIVRAHGGNITVKSIPGSGSTFTIMLHRITSPQ